MAEVGTGGCGLEEFDSSRDTHLNVDHCWIRDGYGGRGKERGGA